MKKNILITGSTDGIGKLAAIKLAHEGHNIYIHGRNGEKVKNVISEIKEASNNENIKGYVANFSDLSEVKKMAQEIISEVSAIDVLINNAGVFKSPNSQNEAGMDMRYVVNYLAPVLLTKDLLTLIEKSEAARIINLSSAAQASISYEVLNGKQNSSEQATYAQSKLALTMWSFHLAKALSPISVIAVNPGSLLNTNMVREAYGRYWSSADKGANILYDLAVSDQHEGVTGKYFDNDKGAYGDAHPDAYDEAEIEKLMVQTNALVGA